MLKTVKMTFEEFDEIEDKIYSLEFECKDWTPTIDEIEYYAKHCRDKSSKDFIKFLLWVIDTYNGKRTKEWIKLEKYINDLLKKYIVFVDDNDADTENKSV